MQHALFIIAPENFRDEELFHPLAVLEKAGITNTIASREAGKCIGSKGGEIEAQIGINQINAEDFDAIIFIGGGGSEIYFEDAAAHLIAQKAFTSGKIVAAICAAPVILAKAGILRGKKATCFPAEEFEKALEENGAILTRSDVEIDGKIITANGPKSATAFGEEIVKKLGK
ncbi:MAG: DJ-1/PfpI family protein [Candidatus Gracilibacteria bacterium]|jgi:protease I